jgi:hypothetical protein
MEEEGRKWARHCYMTRVMAVKTIRRCTLPVTTIGNKAPSAQEVMVCTASQVSSRENPRSDHVI